MVIEDRKVREHGFTLPFHGFQLASWIIFPVDCLLFYLNIGPIIFRLNNQSWLPYFVVILFSIICFVIVFLTALGGRTDPTDPTVYR